MSEEATLGMVLAAITFDVRGRPDVETWLKLLEDVEREAFEAGWRAHIKGPRGNPIDVFAGDAFKKWQER